MLTNLSPLDPALTPLGSDAMHVTDGCYFPAMVMRYGVIDGNPCAIIQYLDETGEPYPVKARPYWWESFKVPLTELKSIGLEVH